MALNFNDKQQLVVEVADNNNVIDAMFVFEEPEIVMMINWAIYQRELGNRDLIY